MLATIRCRVGRVAPANHGPDQCCGFSASSARSAHYTGVRAAAGEDRYEEFEGRTEHHESDVRLAADRAGNLGFPGAIRGCRELWALADR